MTGWSGSFALLRVVILGLVLSVVDSSLFNTTGALLTGAEHLLDLGLISICSYLLSIPFEFFFRSNPASQPLCRSCWIISTKRNNSPGLLGSASRRRGISHPVHLSDCRLCAGRLTTCCVLSVTPCIGVDVLSKDHSSSQFDGLIRGDCSVRRGWKDCLECSR